MIVLLGSDRIPVWCVSVSCDSRFHMSTTNCVQVCMDFCRCMHICWYSDRVQCICVSLWLLFSAIDLRPYACRPGYCIPESVDAFPGVVPIELIHAESTAVFQVHVRLPAVPGRVGSDPQHESVVRCYVDHVPKKQTVHLLVGCEWLIHKLHSWSKSIFLQHLTVT